MEDRTFELLERMYSEFAEFRKETNIRFDNLENDVKDMKKIGRASCRERV